MPPCRATRRGSLAALLTRRGRPNDRWLLDAATAAAAAHADRFSRSGRAPRSRGHCRPIAAIAWRSSPSIYARGRGRPIAATCSSPARSPNRERGRGHPRRPGQGLAEGQGRSQLDADGRAGARRRCLPKLARRPDGPARAAWPTRWGSKALDAVRRARSPTALLDAGPDDEADGRRPRRRRAAADRAAQAATPRPRRSCSTRSRRRDVAGAGRRARRGGRPQRSRRTRRHALVEQLRGVHAAPRGRGAPRRCSRRADWTGPLLDAVEKGEVAARRAGARPEAGACVDIPDGRIADRAKTLLAKAGGLPNPDRQKVIEELLPLAHEDRATPRPARWSSRSSAPSATRTRGEGSRDRPRPDRHGRPPQGRAARPHPRPQPQRRGELPRLHAWRRPTAACSTACWPRRSKTAVELIDAEGKKHVVLREDIERAGRLDEVADARGLREAGARRGDRRPAGVPHAARASTCRCRWTRWPRSSARKGMFYSEGRRRRAAGLPRLDAEDVRGRAVPPRRSRRATACRTSSCSTARRARSRRRCPSRSRCLCNAPAEGDPPPRAASAAGAIPLRREGHRSR